MRPTPKIIGTLLGVLLLLPAIPGIARAAEFDALMVVKDGSRVMPGKIYVHDGKMRQEFVDERGRTITIVRPDKKVYWIIIPQEGVYMEMPLKTTLPNQFIHIPLLAFKKRPLGKELVNGYETEKYQVEVPVGRQVEFQTYWVAAKLGLPIKMECRERHFSMEYRDIKEEKVPDRRFDLPPGVTKTSPGGFADRVEK